MCTAAGQKAASVELLDKANDKMNMQIGGVKWIAYLFFLDIFMTHRHVLWRHCSLIAPLPAAFCCYFIKIGCPAVVGARSGEEWRGYFPRIVCRGRWGRSGLFLRSGVSRCRMSGVFSVTLPSRSAYRTFIGLCRKMRTDGAFVIKSDSSLSVGRPLPRGGKHTGPPCKERP